VPVWKLLGGDNRPVPTNYSIGLCPPEEAAEQAIGIVDQEFSTIKLKIGQDPDVDLDRCRAVRSAIGPETKLRVDANEGWNFVQAKRFLERAGVLQLELIEQPLPRWDFEGLRRLRALSPVPIAADESVRGVDEARRLATMEAVDIFNLKLMKCGGILVARDIVAIARAHGISMMIGGMVGESSVAVAAATAVASTWRFEYADLDADLLLTANYSSGGALHSPTGQRKLSSDAGWPVAQLSPEKTTVLCSC
jgi:L-Ala-D/L-Glu epimerase